MRRSRGQALDDYDDHARWLLPRHTKYIHDQEQLDLRVLESNPGVQTMGVQE